jgi:hypothetical protein
VVDDPQLHPVAAGVGADRDGRRYSSTIDTNESPSTPAA